MHGGHNPTQFRVSLDRDCFICFGDCNRGGSIVDFVSLKERVGIREAAPRLEDVFIHLQQTPNAQVPGRAA